VVQGTTDVRVKTAVRGVGLAGLGGDDETGAMCGMSAVVSARAVGGGAPVRVQSRVP